MRLDTDYSPGKLYITENGASYSDGPDPDRAACMTSGGATYLRDHFAAGQHAPSTTGVPLAGYFVWSLMDNFEWAKGYTQRFGIVWVDYADPAAPAERQRPVVQAGHRRERGGPDANPVGRICSPQRRRALRLCVSASRAFRPQRHPAGFRKDSPCCCTPVDRGWSDLPRPEQERPADPYEDPGGPSRSGSKTCSAR